MRIARYNEWLQVKVMRPFFLIKLDALVYYDRKWHMKLIVFLKAVASWNFPDTFHCSILHFWVRIHSCNVLMATNKLFSRKMSSRSFGLEV